MFWRPDGLYRQVNLSYRESYDHLMGSGLYAALVGAGLLIAHEEVDLAHAMAAGAYRVLRPEPVKFVSYPYEWCFSQLKDAALTTLEVQSKALDFGMSLRDASAFNIQFLRGKPVLIDTLSFEKLRPGAPWVAYAQFCQHFLAPLAVMSYREVRLGQLSRVHIDGLPLDMAGRLLPIRARLRLPLLLHVFLHARAQRRRAGTEGSGTSSGRPFTLRAFRGLIDSLRAGVTKLRVDHGRSAWADYYPEAESYESEAFEHKKALVSAFIQEVHPKVVWDLGANTGLFGRIASASGISTICFDADPECVEASYRRVVEEGETDLLPLVMDLTNPSPGIGWENRERLSVLDRGPADMALALALAHHLVIGNNVPLSGLARFLRAVCNSLAIEFVPKSDPKVRALLSTREDIFHDYTQGRFEAALGQEFIIERRELIKGSERILYLMRGR